MTRTTVNVDDEVLEDARRALGTTGVTQTVNAALRQVGRQAALRRFDLSAFDIDDGSLQESRRERG
jgi:Arc/MetJ family transcription regulator